MSRLLKVALVGAVGLATVGAVATPAAAGSSGTSRPPGTRGVDLKGWSPTTSTVAQLTYRGGPVVSNAAVQTV